MSEAAAGAQHAGVGLGGSAGVGVSVPDDREAGLRALERWVNALRAVDPALDSRTIADVLWLTATATHRAPPGSDPASERAEYPSEATAPNTPEPPLEHHSDPAPPRSPGRHARTHQLYEQVPSRSAEPAVLARPVAVPRSAALTDGRALARSLRPLKRAWSAGSRYELDIEATAESYSRSGELLPALRARAERWIDLALVLDRSPSMAVWQETATELTAVLNRLGAFRRVRTWEMALSAEGAPQFATAGGGPAGFQQPPHIGSKNQIIVLSDFADAGWRRPPIWQTLHRWGACAPTLLVNPLPPRIWRQVSVDLPAVRVTSRGVPAVPNTHLDYHRPWYLRTADKAEQVLTPLPVAALAPYALEDWARVVMSAGSAGGSGQPSCDALLVPAQGRFEDTGAEVDVDSGADAEPVLFPVADELTKSFLAAFSPVAARLAVLYMSLPVITMPMAQLIRERMVPEATVADMAEVIVSGLLMTKTGHEPPTFRPRVTVQPEFQKLLGAADTWQLHDILSGYIESHANSPTTLRAAVPDKAGTVRLSAELLPFAAASAETLRLLGVSAAGEDAVSPDKSKDVETPPNAAAQEAPETASALRNRLLDGLVGQQPSMIAAVLVSSDGLALAASSNLPSQKQSELAAVCSGLIALCQGASRVFEGGGVVHTVVEMTHRFLFIVSASENTHLAVTASSDCDMGQVVYEMTLFVERVGDIAAPQA